MFLYLALMASICGFSACIFFIDFMLLRLQREQHEVDHDGDQHDGPAEVVDEVIVDLVHDQEQRLGQEGEPAEIHHLLQLGIDCAEQVDIFGADEDFEAVGRPAAHGHAAEALRASGRAGVLTVSSNVTTCIAAVAFGQEDGGEVGVRDAGEA